MTKNPRDCENKRTTHSASLDTLETLVGCYACCAYRFHNIYICA